MNLRKLLDFRKFNGKNTIILASSLSLLFFIFLLLNNHISTTNSLSQVALENSDYDRFRIKFVYQEIIEHLYENAKDENIDWSKYAYVFYATQDLHLCNAMMIIHQLKKFNTKANFLLLVNEGFIQEQGQYTILSNFAKEYEVKVKPVQITKKEDGSYWELSFTKLEIFNQFEFERLIYMDTDAILPHGNLDELFFLPPAKLATVTGYWLTNGKYKHSDIYNQPERVFDAQERTSHIETILHNMKSNFGSNVPIGNKNKDAKYLERQKLYYNTLYNSLPSYETIDKFVFTSILMVITPTKDISERVKKSYENRKTDEFDMDMLNFHVFKPSLIITDQLDREGKADLEEEDIPDMLLIPHQVYGCLTGELNYATDHRSFLADPQDQPYIDSEIGHPPKIPYYGVAGKIEHANNWFPKVKYLHYSDYPIPKPWFKINKHDEYMKHKLRCSDNPIFNDDTVVKPDGYTEDCKAGQIWEVYMSKFEKLRKEVCGLDLIG